MARLITACSFLSLFFAAACGGGTPPPEVVRPDTPPSTVLLLQVDGLSPTLLELYLRRSASRGPDRALHRLLGASAAGGGQLTFDQAVVTTAWAPLGGDGVSAGVTLLTGRTAAEHGAWQQNATVPAEIPFVFEQLPGRANAVAGLPARGAQLTAAEGETDTARVEALLKGLPSQPGLVAVRFTGVAAAVAAGPDAAAAAVGEVDRLVARLRAQLPAATLVVLTAGHGSAPQADLTVIDQAGAAQMVENPAIQVRLGGGVLRVENIDGPGLVRLLDAPSVEAIVVHDGQVLGVLDRDVAGFRAVLPGEFPAWPDLAARVQAAAPAGVLLAVARRSAGATFGGGTASRWGGPAVDESQVPVIFAGPMLVGADPHALDGMALTEVAATLRGAVTDGADGRWPALRKKIPAPAAPALASGQVATPFLGALGGPATLTAPPAFGEGLIAFQEGRFSAAAALLGGLKGQPAEVEVWRALLHAWSARLAGGKAEPPPWPQATGAAGRLVAVARLDTAEEGAQPLPPGDDSPLARALAALYAPGGHLCRPSESQRDRLAAATTTFAGLNLPGFAARAETARSKMLAEPEAIRAAHESALAFALLPRAGHVRQSVYRDLLATSMIRNDIAAAADPQLNRIAELLLLDLQASIAAETGPDAGDRRVALIGGLVDGVAAQRQPALMQETVELAVQGQGKVAAAIVRALIGAGGFASLLRGDPMRSLVTMLKLMETALADVAAKPIAQLDADERVARAVPLVITAALKVLQGQPAREDLDQAVALLPLEGTLADREAALKVAGPEGEPTLAAWGPFVRALVLLGQGITALMADDAPAATTHGLAVIELTRRVARAEFARHGIRGLDAHVDALAGVLVAALNWGAAEARADGTAVARASELRAAVKQVPIEAPGADPDVQPWLTLAGVVLHDVAWAVGNRDLAELAPVTAALEKLLTTWHPESRMGQTALLAILAGQNTLPDFEKIKEIKDMESMITSLPRLNAALARVRTEARRMYPEAALAGELQADKVERVILENMLLFLEIEPRTWLSAEALLAPLEARNQAMYALVQDRQGDTRDVLTMVLAFVQAAHGQVNEAATLAAAATTRASGPAFEGYTVIWHTLEARFRALAGDLKGADQAASRAQAACPALAWRIATARGVWLMLNRDPSAAHTQFRAAREGGRQAGVGEYGARFNLSVQDGNSIVTAVVQVPILGVLLGRASGTFQLGAGANSTEAQQRVINWQFAPQGTSADAALDALALEGWLALAAGDEATAGTALSHIMTLFFGTDPRFLDELPVEGLPPYVPGVLMPASPDLLIWFATLASLHGHERLADWVLVALAQRAEAEWPDAPGGRETLCDEATREKGAGDDAAPIVNKVFCTAPSPLAHLLGPEGTEAFAKLVEVRLRARVGQKVDEKQALAAVNKAAPKLLGSVGPGRKALEKLASGKPDVAMVKQAVRAGYACELGIRAADQPELAPLVTHTLQACGLAPFRAVLGVTQNGTSPPEVALANLKAALEIAAWLPGLRDQLFAVGWQQVRVLLARPDQRSELLVRARAWTEVADTLNAPEEALWFRAAALALSPSPAQAEQARALLARAWQQGVPNSEATRYLKRIGTGQDPRPALQEFLP